MGLLTDMIAELRTVITTAVALPNPPSGAINFFTTVQGTKKSVVAQLRNQRISLPFVVLSIGDFAIAQDADLAMNTLGYMVAPVTIIYCSQWGGIGNNQDGAFNAIWSVKLAIESRPSTFLTFTRIEEGAIMSNIDAPINSSLLADSEVQIVAAALAYTPGLRVQLY